MTRVPSSRQPGAGYVAGAARPAPYLLSIRQVAEVLNVGLRLAYEIVKRHDFPGARELSARQRRWIANEVEDWCLRRPIAPGREPPQLKRGREALQKHRS